MNRKLSLILTLTTPLLLLSCSGKRVQASPRIVQTPTYSRHTEPQTQPTLGRVIYRSTQATIKPT